MEWIWEALGIIGIAVILYAIFWFLLPDITRPLPPKKPKVTFIPRDGKAVDISEQWADTPPSWKEPGRFIGIDRGTGEDATAGYFDYTNVTVTPIKDPEYAEYLKNFPADDSRR